MLTPSRLIRRLRWLLTTRRLDAELDEELRFHLDMETTKRMRSGMDERAARERARRDFGGARFRDEARDARGVRALEDFVHDVRGGLRMLARQRTYALVAILTLAVGIGATTGLWAAVYRVLLMPYPFPEAGRIVAVFQYDTRSPGSNEEFAPANYLDLRERSRSFDLLAAAEPWSVDWVGPEGPERFEAALVTADAFPIQGLRPLRGRTFLPEEFQAGRDDVVLLSESLWRGRFGADSALVGRRLVLDSIPRTVIGVMPEDALQPYGAEVWLPKLFRPDEARSRGSGYWTVLGRLAPGVTVEQARAEAEAIASRLAAEHEATNRNTGFRVLTLRDAIAGAARGQLLVLFGAVAFVLLIACVNVANLQLAESVRRRRELAIRTAIGAGRGRIVRQLLTEDVVLATIGAVLALVIAYWVIGAIRAFAPDDLWQLRTLRFDRAALLCAAVLALVSALVIGTVPLLTAGRIHPTGALAAGGRAGIGHARRRANRLLVVTQVALALVLLVGAGLLLRSLSALLGVDRGFRTERVLVTTVQAWGYYPTPAARAEYVRQAVDRLAVLPGVERVGTTSSLPLSYPIGFERPRVQIEGQPAAPGNELPTAHVAAVSPEYLATLDIPVLRGRGLTADDGAGSVPVVVVNRAFARRFLGDREPVGARVVFGFMGPAIAREIVGVVGDVRHDGLHAEPRPSMFVPHAQASTGAIHLVARTTGDPVLLQRHVRDALAELNGVMPLSDITTMDALLARSLRERRFQLGLLAAFSGTALLLSAIGIFGVMSRATSERTHEIGVRMAIGARAGDVRWMVLRSGGTLAATGIAAGGVAALFLTRFLAGMLYDVTPLDPLTYIGAAGLLLLAALLASWVPAWRASAVDPVIALRSD
ncbi:MAG TPA: ABC transporter permease [Gemmatimonadaceae bacterium]|nr:ABC transporter permease [Gemmatimonadaceae bacterium]